MTPHLATSAQSFLVFGSVAISIAALALLLLAFAPNTIIRLVLWTAGCTFRVRAVGCENVPRRGPALLVANHVTFADGLLIGSCLPRHIRFLVWQPYYRMRSLHWIFQLIQAIPVPEEGPREMVASLRLARQALAENHLVCIFAEGGITRTGELLPFKRGMEKIAERFNGPIIPIHLDGLWGSLWSFSGGRILWKKPQLTSRVTITFGAPMPAGSPAHSVRRAVELLAEPAREESLLVHRR
jgi:acyl-[acyl-carrier-protein]-phospholipid O-acyltransferase/long-chain-fatty-acid--[acyl-carrier-protein] ligase